MDYATLLALAEPAVAEQAALDALDAHVARITDRTPRTRDEAAELVATLAGELERLFPKVSATGPIHAGLRSLAIFITAA